MGDELAELIRIDSTGAAHPVGRTASQRMRARQGAFRLMPGPAHLIVMRYVGEDGRRDDEDGPVFRLAGEITAAGTLCDIFGLVGQAGWKGELVVLDGVTSRSIFFDHSHVIGALSTAEGERLGEVLYRYGALTEEQVAEAAKSVTADVRFGEAAVKLGFISRERLFQLMGKQTEEIVYAMLLVGDGMFYFLDSFDEARIPARQSLSVNGLLMEGVRRMDETRYFRERIPSDQHVPEILPDRGTMPEDELRPVYEAIDGTRTVAEIGRIVGMGEFEITQALFQLVQSNRVVIRSPRPTGPAAVVALFNEAMQLIFQEVARVGRSDEVRGQLASFATGAGMYDALFRKCGPHADGTVTVEGVTENIQIMVGPGQAEAMLAQWLYEYVSFAVFVAEPLLRQTEAAPLSRVAGAAAPAQIALSTRIGALVAPLARNA